jgi:signal transduction histidine kinase
MYKSRIRHALIDLIENAIKYSWCGKMEEGIKKLHEVRIWIDTSDYDTVMVKITNYGIGIPPYLRETIFEPGRRGMVFDSKIERKGTGFGLPIANYLFKEHGGRLEIDSYPADDEPRGIGEEYHRYVTEVRAYLPTYR